MIYKVFYQDSIDEVPVRERTSSLYIEADSERDVRQKLKGRNYNIEFIQAIDGKFLEFEEKSNQFEVERI